MTLNIIPLCLQLSSDFSNWTVSVGTIVLPDETAGALLHVSYDVVDGISLDVFYLQLILQKFV